MAITTVLFDLDGTLLPMDQDEFVSAYFGNLAKFLAPHGYEPKKLVDSIWAGTKAMITNDGTKSNEAAFWAVFTQIHGEASIKDEPLFDEFYRTQFQTVKEVCGFNAKAAEAIAKIKSASLRTALTTNPIFPAVATKSRIAWAGLETNDFEFFTTYENSSFCKPNLNYYTEVCKKLNIAPEECLMVGNDVGEDMITQKLGMKVFLLTDCLINKSNEDISKYPQGSFDKLIEYIESL